MKATEIIKGKKQVFAIAGIVIAAILLAFAGGMAAFFSGHAGAGDIGSGNAVGFVMGHAADGIEPPATEEAEAEEELEEVVAEDQEAAEPVQGEVVEAQAAEQRSDASSGQSGPVASSVPAQSSGGSSDSKSGHSAPSNPAPQKKWVEDTQRVWVEDKAAWSESVPVYGTKEVSICNVCGADITGNTAAHSKAHMMAGEGSGHHNEVQKVVTGYNTVNHPAEGHWETKVVGGHWE